MSLSNFQPPEEFSSPPKQNTDSYTALAYSRHLSASATSSSGIPLPHSHYSCHTCLLVVPTPTGQPSCFFSLCMASCLLRKSATITSSDKVVRGDLTGKPTPTLGLLILCSSSYLHYCWLFFGISLMKLHPPHRQEACLSYPPTDLGASSVSGDGRSGLG